MEYQTTAYADSFDPIEFRGFVSSDGGHPIEERRQIRGDGGMPIELCCVALRVSGLPAQWAGSLAVAAEAVLPLEFTAIQLAKARSCTEWMTIQSLDAGIEVEHLWKLLVDPKFCAEFGNLRATDLQLGLELLAASGGETTLVLESMTSGARITTDEPLYLEWTDPPAPVPVVAYNRLLRSPGRVRILAGPGSVHRLRGS